MPTAHVLFGTGLPAQRRSRNARNAFPCLPRPPALSPAPAEVILAHLLWQEAPTHVLGIKHGRGGSLHPLAPRLGTWPRYSGWALRHSPFPCTAYFPSSQSRVPICTPSHCQVKEQLSQAEGKKCFTGL